MASLPWKYCTYNKVAFNIHKSLSVVSKKQFSSHYTVAAMIEFAKLESVVPIIKSFLVCLLTS